MATITHKVRDLEPGETAENIDIVVPDNIKQQLIDSAVASLKEQADIVMLHIDLSATALVGVNKNDM